jgi:hypothetical protein
MRIDFIDKSERDIFSEKRVIINRNKIRNFIKEYNPEASIRILEEPPGPPTQSTYQLKIQ